MEIIRRASAGDGELGRIDAARAPTGHDKDQMHPRLPILTSTITTPLMHRPTQPVTMLSFRDPPTPQSISPSISPSIQEDVIANETSALDRVQDPGSSYCYRHRPEAHDQRLYDGIRMTALHGDLKVFSPDEQASISNIWSLFGAAPARQRYLILKGILTQCCFPQLSTVSREVEQQLRIDFLSVLPVEISERILGYLDTASLCRASQVSRWWRELADADGVWRRMCVQHIDRKCTKCGWGIPLLERKRLGLKGPTRRDTAPPGTLSPTLSSASRKRVRLAENVPTAKRRCVTPPAPASEAHSTPSRPRPWKDVYRDRWIIGANWRLGRYHEMRLAGHQKEITCAQFEEDTLATGCRDSTIKLWDTTTGQEIRTLAGHAMAVTTLQFDNGKLISGSEDTTIKIWNWRTGECLNTLQVHSRPVTTLHFDGRYLASGSTDGTVKLFNFETKRTCNLVGHTGAITHIRMDPESRTIFTTSNSDSGGVKMWDLDTLQCIKTYDGRCGHVQQLLLMPDDFEPDEATPKDDASSSRGTPRLQDQRILYGSSFTSDTKRSLPPRYLMTSSRYAMHLWDTATGECIRNTFIDQNMGMLVGDTLRVVTGAGESALKVWEPTSGKCERVFAGHDPDGVITAVGLSDRRMVSGTLAGELVLYSFDHVQEQRLVGECGF